MRGRQASSGAATKAIAADVSTRRQSWRNCFLDRGPGCANPGRRLASASECAIVGIGVPSWQWGLTVGRVSTKFTAGRRALRSRAKRPNERSARAATSASRVR